MKRAFIVIDYNEATDKGFNGIVVSDLDKPHDAGRRFDSGDFVVDWRRAIMFAKAKAAKLVFSSSVDHFLMDHCERFEERKNNEIVRLN